MIRVRQAILKGHRSIHALWFGRQLTIEAKLRQLILRAWIDGCELYRFPSGYLLLYTHGVFVDCQKVDGLPLHKIDKRLFSFDIDLETHAHQLDRLADAFLLQSGAISSLRFADAKLIDVSEWLPTDHYTVIDTYEVSTNDFVLTHLPAAAKTTVREVFGSAIPPPSAEQGEFLKQLQQRGRPTAGETRGKDSDGFSLARPLLQAALLTLQLPLVLLGLPLTSGYSDANAISARQRPQQPQRWREWATRLALLTRAARFLGWRQGKYLRNLLDKFEQNDLAEALRHAIPLGDGQGSLGQAFGGFKARNDLRIQGATRPGSSVHFGDEIEAHLRQLYRQAFNRLSREGKIDEAAFVLAELLRAKQEALDYLVTHNRSRQAAELALAWDMPADTIVRLLCLAEEWERAIRVARRDNAFAAVVTLLQKDRPELAKRLRYEWAQSLTQRGEWLAAVDVIWPLDDARALAGEWLTIAEAAGGVLGLHAIVQQLLRTPGSLVRHQERLHDIINDSSAYASRHELAVAILALNEQNRDVQRLAAHLLPPLMEDTLCGLNALSPKQLQKLLNISNDPLLKVDALLPSSHDIAAPVNLLRQQVPTRFTAPEIGLQTILDVAPLASNYLVIAHGEAGISIVNELGQTLNHYALPCHRLVVAHSGNVLLALAKRDSIWRVTRLSLATHEAHDLGSIVLEFFAPRFDGIAWTVVSNNAMLVLDCSNTLRDVLWKVSDLPGRVIRFSSDTHSESLLIQNDQGMELWRYQLPGRRLLSRDPPAEPPHQAAMTSLMSSGRLIYCTLKEQDQQLILYCRYINSDFSIDLGESGGQQMVQISGNDGLLAICTQTMNTQIWYLIDAIHKSLMATVHWPVDGTFKHCGNRSVIFDATGRVLNIDLQLGVARNYTLR